MSDKTHFGFEEVNTADKSKKVGNVFHSVAEEYLSRPRSPYV